MRRGRRHPTPAGQQGNDTQAHRRQRSPTPLAQATRRHPDPLVHLRPPAQHIRASNSRLTRMPRSHRSRSSHLTPPSHLTRQSRPTPEYRPTAPCHHAPEYRPPPSLRPVPLRRFANGCQPHRRSQPATTLRIGRHSPISPIRHPSSPCTTTARSGRLGTGSTLWPVLGPAAKGTATTS